MEDIELDIEDSVFAVIMNPNIEFKLSSFYEGEGRAECSISNVKGRILIEKNNNGRPYKAKLTKKRSKKLLEGITSGETIDMKTPVQTETGIVGVRIEYKHPYLDAIFEGEELPEVRKSGYSLSEDGRSVTKTYRIGKRIAEEMRETPMRIVRKTAYLTRDTYRKAMQGEAEQECRILIREIIRGKPNNILTEGKVRIKYDKGLRVEVRADYDKSSRKV